MDEPTTRSQGVQTDEVVIPEMRDCGVGVPESESSSGDGSVGRADYPEVVAPGARRDEDAREAITRAVVPDEDWQLDPRVRAVDWEAFAEVKIGRAHV